MKCFISLGHSRTPKMTIYGRSRIAMKRFGSPYLNLRILHKSDRYTSADNCFMGDKCTEALKATTTLTVMYHFRISWTGPMYSCKGVISTKLPSCVRLELWKYG